MNICILSDAVKKEKRMPLIPDDIIELKTYQLNSTFILKNLLTE